MLLISRHKRGCTSDHYPIRRAAVAATSVAAVALAFWVALAASTAAGDMTELTLGGYPLCEASAALAVPCPDAEDEDETCLVVGDNEIEDRLFLFSFGKDAPDTLVARREIPMLSEEGKTKSLSDIEAAAKLSSGELLIYGSHSRDKRCDPEKERRRMFRGGLAAANFEVADSTSSKKPTCERLFGVSTENAHGNMKRLCATMDAAEDAADKVDEKLENEELDEPAAEAQCNEIQDFNLEGAVAIQNNGEEEIWVGLRAPVVGEEEHAVLLRQKSRKVFEFDAVVRLDLEGVGVRELAADKKFVWVIAGPPNDSDAKHTLRRFPLSALAAENVASGDALIAPEDSSLELPTSAEGLAILGDKAVVMIDGDEPKTSPLTCEKSSTYGVISTHDF